MNIERKISGDEFLKLYENAVAVDYAGQYMSVQYDEELFIFLPNVEYHGSIEFERSIVERGVYVNQFGDCFRFDSEDCEWFQLLSALKVTI